MAEKSPPSESSKVNPPKSIPTKDSSRTKVEILDIHKKGSFDKLNPKDTEEKQGV